MLLCLDIGNTQIHIGLADENTLQVQNSFRLETKQKWNTDDLKEHFELYFSDNKIQKNSIKAVLLSSVVPSIDNTIKDFAKKFLELDVFELKYNVKMNLSLNSMPFPERIGADLLASSIAAADIYKDKNILVIDMGTATTITVINNYSEYKGYIIMPGINTQLVALVHSAEKLNSFKLNERSDKVVGTYTEEAIQSGIINGHYGAIKYLCEQMASEAFGDEEYLTIATGGLLRLFGKEHFFDAVESDLVLKGLIVAYKANVV